MTGKIHLTWKNAEKKLKNLKLRNWPKKSSGLKIPNTENVVKNAQRKKRSWKMSKKI